MELTRWQLLHEYMKGAREGRYPMLVCDLCDGQVVPLDRDPSIVLWCPFDDVEIRVGLNLLDQMKEQINAVYI